MTKVYTDPTNYTNIAAAIREKNGSQTTYKPSQMAAAIRGIAPSVQALAVTENGTYTAPEGVDGYSPVTVNVQGGGSSADYSLVGFLDSGTKTKKGFVHFGFSSGGIVVLPTDSNGNLLDFDWSQPFEIGVVAKYTGTVSHSNVLFGCNTAGIYYRCPSLEIQGNGSVRAGFSTSGSSWNYGLWLPAGTLEINTWYYIYYKWNGTSFEIGATKDYTNIVKSTAAISTAHYHSASYKIAFGGIAQSSNHNADKAEINVRGTYIKTNNTLVWGCNYLEQNNIFE